MYSFKLTCRDYKSPVIDIQYSKLLLNDNIYINQKINNIKKQFNIHTKYNKKKTNKYLFFQTEINILLKNELNKLMLNISLQDAEILQRIQESKNQINKSFFKNEWDKTKKYTNPYEFIYCIPKKNDNEFKTASLTTIDPLSRSFFKMIEMSNVFLSDLIDDPKPHNTLHLAEGPGGFIEAYAYLRNKNKNYNTIQNKECYDYIIEDKNYLRDKLNRVTDTYYGITLINRKYEVPGWKKSTQFLKKNKNVHILSGIDGIGDLYNIDNIKYLINKFKFNKVKLVTGDGGFDFSIDYNLQEYMASKLLLSQIIVALGCLDKNGTFICKFYDLNNKLSVELIYLLQCHFKNLHIFKPKSSRLANSEKYIICKGFKNISSEYLDILINLLNRFNEVEKENERNIHYFTKYICDKLCNGGNTNNNLDFNRNENKDYELKIINMVYNYSYKTNDNEEKIPSTFFDYIRNTNKQIVDIQIKNINYTINIIKQKNKHSLDNNWLIKTKKKLIDNAIDWCIQNNISYNNIYKNTNKI